MNKEKIRDECGAKIRGEMKEKTKTRKIESIISDPNYKRKPDEFLMKHQNIAYARAYIMGRFGMLDCASNFAKKYGGKDCRRCGVKDDENHRINECTAYQLINRRNCDTKVDFLDICCNSDEKVLNVVKCILAMWDLERCKNQIREPSTD